MDRQYQREERCFPATCASENTFSHCFFSKKRCSWGLIKEELDSPLKAIGFVDDLEINTFRNPYR